MIWSLFTKSKEPRLLIQELKDENEEVNRAAYRQLINSTSEDCDPLLVNELSSPATPKELKLDIINILGLRATESAIPLFQKILKGSDREMLFAVVEALYNIGTPDAIDELVKYITVNDDDLKKTVTSLVLKIPSSELMGSLLRCVPEDKNSQLYFDIVTIMEDL